MNTIILTLALMFPDGSYVMAEGENRYETVEACEVDANLIGVPLVNYYEEVVAVKYKCEQGVVL